MKKIGVGLLALTMGTSAMAETPSIEELYEIIQKQQAEIEALKEQDKVVEERLDYTAEAVEQASSASGGGSGSASKTSIGGYGELHYNNYSDSSKDDQIDFHRFVLFFGHEFRDDLRFFSELEIEHAYSGDDLPGKVELEQAYVEWDYADQHRAKAGLFLLPVGILNETHEPDTFYGTERNPVEKNIIPTTWWESGAEAAGEFGSGFSYNAGAHSGLFIDTANGDYKVRDGRQKSAKAIANNGAFTGRLKYTGLAGLELALTAQYQTDVQQDKGTDSSDATLIETHAIYNVAGFGLRALYATWDISGTDFETVGADEQTGWYIEPSYRFNEKVGIFARYNEWNNFAGLAASQDNEVIDYGINYWFHPQVVFKADWSDDQNNSKNDTFNLGLGYSF